MTPPNKAQGSLEYLLILAAILAIAVVTVVVANQMLNPAETAAAIQQDKYVCGLQSIELIDYDKPYVGTKNTCPDFLKYEGEKHEFVSPIILDTWED